MPHVCLVPMRPLRHLMAWTSAPPVKHLYLHIPFSTNQSIVGTLPFMSINGQQGYIQSHYNDLESLIYTIVYAAHGDLPWTRSSVHSNHEAVLQMKLLTKSCVRVYPPSSVTLSAMSIPLTLTGSWTINTFTPFSCRSPIPKPRLTCPAMSYPLPTPVLHRLLTPLLRHLLTPLLCYPLAPLHCFLFTPLSMHTVHLYSATRSKQPHAP